MEEGSLIGLSELCTRCFIYELVETYVDTSSRKTTVDAWYQEQLRPVREDDLPVREDTLPVAQNLCPTPEGLIGPTLN